ncbi:MAG TPA: polyphenol oxidase family protein [Nocardioides sp.]
MFAFRERREGDPDRSTVEVAFTDSTLDLQGTRPGFGAALGAVVEASGVGFARMNQVHGVAVHVVDAVHADPDASLPTADAMVTTTVGVGLMVRVADCVPILLADASAGVVSAVHAGRGGMSLDIATLTVEQMAARGATDIEAWIGPHVCGRCYEVPEAMRDEVSRSVPESYSTTSWGTPALDIGAGVAAQLERAGVAVNLVDGCTLEQDRFHSFRRDGAASGRMAGLVWLA